MVCLEYPLTISVDVLIVESIPTSLRPLCTN